MTARTEEAGDVQIRLIILAVRRYEMQHLAKRANSKRGEKEEQEIGPDSKDDTAVEER